MDAWVIGNFADNNAFAAVSSTGTIVFLIIGFFAGIATGGGVILREENLHALRRSGRLVFLDRSLDKLTAAADRPLSADTDALRCRYAERYDLYCAAADLRVDGDGTPEETAAQIEKEWTT